MLKLTTYFNESCVAIDYPCKTGTTVADPCDCQKFYECEADTYGFLSRTCAEGLFWNHLNGNCERQNEIAIGKKICIPDTSWMRCANVSEKADLSALLYRCTGSTVIPTTSAGVTVGTPAPSSDNTGVIVGGVIGGLLVVAIIVAIIVFLVKKEKPLSYYGEFLNPRLKKTVSNPEYVDQDEQYAELNDVVYKDSSKDQTMTRPSVPSRPDVSISINQKANDIFQEEVEYDNPGYAQDTLDPDDVTVNVSRRTVDKQDPITNEEQPIANYFLLDKSVLDVAEGRSYSSLYQTKVDGAGLTDDEGYQVPTPQDVAPNFEIEQGHESIHVNLRDGL